MKLFNRYIATDKRRRPVIAFAAFLSLIVLLPVAVFLARNAGVVKADSLFGFNEEAGSTVRDVAGSITGTITNAVWKLQSDCLIGTCLYFDGSGDYISFGDEASYDFAAATNFSIEFWFKTDDITAGTRTFVSKYRGDDAEGGYSIYMTSDGLVHVGIDDDNSFDPDDAASSTAAYDDNQWHHVAAVKTGTTSVRLYIDAVMVGEDTSISASGTLVNDDAFVVGAASDLASNPFTGYFDELKVYTATARSEAEIKADFAKASSLAGAKVVFGSDTSTLGNGLVGYWKLDETSAGTYAVPRYDSSGNNNTLVDNGTTPSAEGKIGNSSSHNPTNTELLAVDDANQTGLEGFTQFSFSFWLRPNTLSAHGIVINKDSTNGQCSYRIRLYSDYRLSFNWCDDGFYDSANDIWSDINLVSANVWQFITFTYDGSTLRLYKNGVEQTSNEFPHSSSGQSIFNSTSPFSIGGGASNGVAQYYNGRIDEVRAYNRSLSETEIQALYAWMPGPVATWKFDEGTGTTANNTGVNQSVAHGTLGSSTQAPAWVNDGKIGKALDFEADNDTLVTIADTTTLSLTGSLAVSAWIKPESTTADTIYPIAAKWNSVDHSYALVQYGGELRMYIDSDTIYATSTNASLSPGSWYHVTGVYSSSSQSVTLYLDGNPLQTSVTGTIPAAISDDSNVFAIGGFGATGNSDVFTIAADGDDGTEALDTTWVPSGANLGFGYYSGVYNNIHTGVRFTNVTIPQGATITNAYLRVYGNTSYGTTWHARIVADDTDNAAAWGASDRPSQLSNITTSYTNWDPASFPVDTWINSPAITAVIQEIVDRSGWSSGNALRLAIRNNGTTGTNVTGFDEYSVSPSTATQLVVEYESGSEADDGYFDGLIDEVSVYDGALTAAQVRSIYTRGSAMMGSTGTDSSGAADNSAAREYCVPGDATACSPPVVHLKFNENSGTQVTDSNGRIATGSFGDTPEWVLGKIGSAVNFGGTGSDDRVGFNVPLTAIDNLSQMSFSVWMYPRSTGEGGYGRVFSRCETITGCRAAYMYGTNQVEFIHGWSTSTGQYARWNTPTNSITLNQWNHLTITYDNTSTDNDPVIYINGVRQVLNEPSSPSGVVGTDAADILFIGNRMVSGTTYDRTFDGVIDEFKIYSYLRTPAQVAWEYNKGEPLAWYKLDECQNTTAYNSALNGNGAAMGFNGTITFGTLGNTSAGTCNSGAGTEMWNDGSTGKLNAGLGFDGSDDVVTVADTAELRFDAATSDFSVFTWVKRNVVDADQLLLGKTDGADDGYELKLNANNTVTCSVNNLDAVSTKTITDTGWHHVGCVVDRDGNATVFIDSQASGTVAIGSAAMATTATITIGSGLNGILDDVRIYPYAVTPTQIKTIMNSGSVRL